MELNKVNATYDLDTIFVVWQDSVTRLWHPIGKLTYKNSLYRFNYTKGCKASPRFKPFIHMENIDYVYESKSLFPFFENRVLDPSREEFREIIRWTDIEIDSGEFNHLEFLAKTGGERKTDSYRIIPCPSSVDGYYVMDFFIHGMNYLNENQNRKLQELSAGDELEMVFEDENQIDPMAILITKDGSKLGYCPKYLAHDFREVLIKEQLTEKHLIVKQLNLDAPAKYKVLCRFITKWPKDFAPFNNEDYLAVNNKAHLVA